MNWGQLELNPAAWHEIDDLWIRLDPRDGETDISHVYSRPGATALQFSALTEFRIPVPAGLTVEQRLSTRPVVARPHKSITIPSRERIRLFVGTPLWFTLLHGSDVLLDLPVSRVSDTWFGNDTRNGEICFDCRTKARLSMDDTPPNPHKAITPVEIHNDSDRPITIDRLNLPIPHINLFRDEIRHWTSPLVLQTGDRWSDEIRVTIGSEPPPESPDASPVASARTPIDAGFLNKTMNLLLG